MIKTTTFTQCVLYIGHHFHTIYSTRVHHLHDKGK